MTAADGQEADALTKTSIPPSFGLEEWTSLSAALSGASAGTVSQLLAAPR